MQKPTTAFPEAGDATVTVVHRGTRDLSSVTRQADILIAAVGAARFVTGDMVKQGAAVIDVGINSVNGKLVGDVDAATVEPVAGWLSPVPKGVGPMTIAMLLHNTLKATTPQRHDVIHSRPPAMNAYSGCGIPGRPTGQSRNAWASVNRFRPSWKSRIVTVGCLPRIAPKSSGNGHSLPAPPARRRSR